VEHSRAVSNQLSRRLVQFFGVEGFEHDFVGSRSGTHPSAPCFNGRLYSIADVPHAAEFVLVTAVKIRWIEKAPMQAPGGEGDDTIALRPDLIGERDDDIESHARPEQVRGEFGLCVRKVHAAFAHYMADQRVRFGMFKAGAVGFEAGAAKLMQETRGHLAEGAVLFGYKEDILFHDG